jgi:phosphate/sulfate permease
MLGVSLVYTLTRSKQREGIHWDQAGQVLLSLLISPVVGFGAAALILLALQRFVKTPRLFEPADPEKSPPTGFGVCSLRRAPGSALPMARMTDKREWDC